MHRRNTIIFLIVVSFLGLTYGIYEISIPFFLQSQHISFPRMGGIFAISFLFAFLMRQYAGYLSDRFGRKPFFSLALFLSGLGNFGTPFFSTAAAQAFLKSLLEGAYGIKETMQSVILYEGSEDRPKNRGLKKDFLNTYGKNRGTEWVFQAAGIFLAGMIAVHFSLSAPFFVSAIILFLAAALFWIFFQAPKTGGTGKRLNAREVFHFDLTGKLRYLTVVYFMLNFNTGLSHGPIMPIFFKDRFGMSLVVIASLMVVHRLFCGLPMLLAGRLHGGNLKSIYLVSLFISGISLALTPFIPRVSVAIPVWLVHDLLGSGFYVPIHNYLIQKYAGEGIRGLHVSKSFAYGTLGIVPGYLLSGYLYSFNIGAPFFAAGIVALLTCFLVARL